MPQPTPRQPTPRQPTPRPPAAQPPAAQPHVVLHDVTRAFAAGRLVVLDRLSLVVGRGEITVLLGPSGCGKTTLLRMIAGLLPPDRGQVLIDGHAPRPGLDTATVFQSYRLLPWKTVAENIAFALHGLTPEARAARVGHYLALVGLDRFARSYPAELSGGMRQRLALARALAAEAPVLLMDEPFAALDAQARELMQDEVLDLAQRLRPTIFFVTHSVDEALRLADRIVLMSPRPGRLDELIWLDQPRPRRPDDPGLMALRARLWARLRQMVLSDPQSDFYGRGQRRPEP